jgi:hypothetical protein
MKAKEKADTLYWKYYQLVADCSHPEEKAKECALIAVDELIKSKFSKKWHNNNGIIVADYLLRDYWEKVKQEIEKL